MSHSGSISRKICIQIEITLWKVCKLPSNLKVFIYLIYLLASPPDGAIGTCSSVLGKKGDVCDSCGCESGKFIKKTWMRHTHYYFILYMRYCYTRTTKESQLNRYLKRISEVKVKGTKRPCFPSLFAFRQNSQYGKMEVFFYSCSL